MTYNEVQHLTKDTACQELLKAHPPCSGWVRRKTILHGVGAKIESQLKIGRSMSVTNKIPWQQRYMIMYEDVLYIFKDETASRAQKILTLSNYCRFVATTNDQSKDVPWPFHLEPANALLTKVECFSAVSETELQKWQDVITPKLGSAVQPVCDEASSDDSDYDKPNDPETLRGRTLPLPPRQAVAVARCDRKLPPTPSADPVVDRAHRTLPLPPPSTSDNNGLQNRKVPAVPTAEIRQKAPDQRKKSPPPVAPKRHSKPATATKPGMPVPSNEQPKTSPPPPPITPKHKLPSTKEEPDGLTYETAELPELQYEMGLVDAAIWRKTAEEAQEFMKQSGLPEGLYLIRESTDGKGYTLLVVCQGGSCKFKIDKDGEMKVRMGTIDFDNLEALIVHFSGTNLPNKTTKLTKAHSVYEPQ